jgi:replicative DNA helicase
LGSLIYDHAKVIGAVLDAGLTPDHFTDDRNQVVWSAMNGMERVDIVSLTSELRRLNSLEEAGGATYVNLLVDDANPMYIDEYIGILQRDWVSRHAQDILEKFIERIAKAKDPIITVGEAMDELGQLDNTTKRDDDPDEIRKGITKTYEAIAAHDLSQSVPFPFPALTSKAGGLMLGQHSVLAAKRGYGKSTLIIHWLVMLGRMGIPAAYFPYEDGVRQARKRMAANYAGIAPFFYERGSSQIPVASFDAAMEAANKLPIQVVSCRGMTTRKLKTEITRLKAMHDCKLFVVDGFKDIPKSKGENETARENQTSQELCDVAESQDIALCSIMHMKKGQAFEKYCSECRTKLPTKRVEEDDLRGSGRIVDDARLLMAINRWSVPITPEMHDMVFSHAEKDQGWWYEYDLDIIKSNNTPLGTAEFDFYFPYHRAMEGKRKDVYKEIKR